MNGILFLLLYAILIVLALSALLNRASITIVILAGAFSFVIAALFAALGAVDVSFTEAVVGASVSSLFFIAALISFHKTGIRKEPASAGNHRGVQNVTRIVTGVLLLGFAIIISLAALDFPGFGSLDSPASGHVAKDYVERAYADTHTPNVVTAILADYRGWDTLGETVVVFTAGMAVFAVLGLRAQKK